MTRPEDLVDFTGRRDVANTCRGSLPTFEPSPSSSKPGVYRSNQCEGQKNEKLVFDYAKASRFDEVKGICPACRGTQVWASGRRDSTNPEDTCTCVSSLKQQAKTQDLEKQVKALGERVEHMSASSKRLLQQFNSMKTASTQTFTNLDEKQRKFEGSLARYEFSNRSRTTWWVLALLAFAFLAAQVGVLWAWTGNLIP